MIVHELRRVSTASFNDSRGSKDGILGRLSSNGGQKCHSCSPLISRTLYSVNPGASAAGSTQAAEPGSAYIRADRSLFFFPCRSQHLLFRLFNRH
jgi:hypothetical protein